MKKLILALALIASTAHAERDYIELEGFIGKTLYIVYKPSELWVCNDEAFMDRVFIIDTKTYAYCLFDHWQKTVSEEIGQAVDIQLRVRELRHELFHLDENIHRQRVSNFWYTGVDTHRIPQERPKELILVCNNDQECAEERKAWVDAYNND